MDDTIRYYDEAAADFYQNTVSADMSEHYQVFEKYLPQGGRVLDAGCGSGRDALHFRNQGYEVTAFDASSEMVRLSSALTGLNVLQETFETFCSSESFDGIWACASLLHNDRTSIAGILGKLAHLLRTGGVMYMSFKAGDRVYQKGGRLFNCYDEPSLRDLLESLPELEILKIYQTPDVRADRPDEFWISAIVRRTEESQ